MNVSPASEIHFWKTGELSFNNEQEGFTQDFKFNQRFICDAERRLQGYGIEDRNYRLSIQDCGNEIETLDYVRTAVGGSAEIPESEEDMGLTHPNTWASAAGSTVRTTDYPFIAGRTYTITLHLEKEEPAIATNDLLIRNSITNDVIFSSTVDSPEGGGTFDLTITFVATSDCNSIRWFRGGILPEEEGRTECVTIDGTVTIPAVPAVPPTYYLYTLSFNPDDYDLCDNFFSFKIIQTAVDPEDEIEEWYSDEIEFVTEWVNSESSGRVNIKFKSVQNFAGLIYDQDSEYFSIDIEGRFRKEKKVTTQKNLDLTDIVLTTASSLKIQRRLTIEDAADYIHTKINLILAHAASGSVVINNKEWSVEDGYEEGTRPDTYPLSPADIFLTEKDAYYHNVQ